MLYDDQNATRNYIYGLAGVEWSGEGLLRARKVSILPRCLYSFRTETVRYAWANVASGEWWHDNDPITSAKLYLEKHGDKERIKLLKMPEITGTKTLAFVIDDFIQEWAQNAETLLVDSTCEYNLINIFSVLTN